MPIAAYLITRELDKRDINFKKYLLKKEVYELEGTGSSARHEVISAHDSFEKAKDALYGILDVNNVEYIKGDHYYSVLCLDSDYCRERATMFGLIKQ